MRRMSGEGPLGGSNTTGARRGTRKGMVGLLAAVSIASLGLVFIGGASTLPAFAQSPAAKAASPASSPKEYWQERYRNLLTEADKLRRVIEEERELYADANRRNYRRGDKRHRHRGKFLEAEEKLRAVEAKLSTIKDEGRRAGALPGWFYEVELEAESLGGRPPIERGPGESGRNPRFEEVKR